MTVKGFKDFNLFNPQVLVCFPACLGVEIGGFSMGQPSGLIPGHTKFLFDVVGDLLKPVTPQKPLGQGALNAGNQIGLVFPTAIPEGLIVSRPWP